MEPYSQTRSLLYHWPQYECCLASTVEKINIHSFQGLLPVKRTALSIMLYRTCLTCFSYIFDICGSWGFWTLSYLDLNPEHLKSCEGRKSERRVVGPQRRVGVDVGEIRDVFPNHKLEKFPLQPERGRGGNSLWQLCFLEGGDRNVVEDGCVGPLVSLVCRKVTEDPLHRALHRIADGAVEQSP